MVDLVFLYFTSSLMFGNLLQQFVVLFDDVAYYR